jgi:hypothetical protein
MAKQVNTSYRFLKPSWQQLPPLKLCDIHSLPIFREANSQLSEIYTDDQI